MVVSVIKHMPQDFYVLIFLHKNEIIIGVRPHAITNTIINSERDR